MSVKVYLFWVILLGVSLLFYGQFLPTLINAASTPEVALGLLLCLGYPALVVPISLKIYDRWL